MKDRAGRSLARRVSQGSISASSQRRPPGGAGSRLPGLTSEVEKLGCGQGRGKETVTTSPHPMSVNSERPEPWMNPS